MILLSWTILLFLRTKREKKSFFFFTRAHTPRNCLKTTLLQNISIVFRKCYAPISSPELLALLALATCHKTKQELWKRDWLYINCDVDLSVVAWQQLICKQISENKLWEGTKKSLCEQRKHNKTMLEYSSYQNCVMHLPVTYLQFICLFIYFSTQLHITRKKKFSIKIHNYKWVEKNLSVS